MLPTQSASVNPRGAKKNGGFEDFAWAEPANSSAAKANRSVRMGPSLGMRLAPLRPTTPGYLRLFAPDLSLRRTERRRRNGRIEVLRVQVRLDVRALRVRQRAVVQQDLEELALEQRIASAGIALRQGIRLPARRFGRRCLAGRNHRPVLV